MFLSLLQNIQYNNITFFFSGLLFGSVVTGTICLFDNINKNKIIQELHYSLSNFNNTINKLENDKYKLLKNNRKLSINNTELNERITLLNITNNSRIIHLENENKMLTHFANNIRNNGIFGFNIVKSPRVNYNDTYYFGYNYKNNNNIMIIGNNVIVKQSFFEV